MELPKPQFGAKFVIKIPREEKKEVFKFHTKAHTDVLPSPSVLHSAQTLERYHVDTLNSGYYIVLINSHEDIFRYISGHSVLDEDYQDRAENVSRFFLLSPSESSVFQVCTEKITVYQINLLKVQKTGS